MGKRHLGFALPLAIAVLAMACSEEKPEMQPDVTPLAGAGASAPVAGTPAAGMAVAGTSLTDMPGAGAMAGVPTDPMAAAGMTTDMPGAGAMAGMPSAGEMDEMTEGGSTADVPETDEPATTTASALPPVSDYTEAGPFQTTMESNTGPDGNYTIFRPEPLGTDGFVHPLITFGPGILTSPSNYTTLLSHLASHGFVTICVNSLSAGPGSPANVEAMETGLDWLIAQNSEAGGFQGMLAVDRAVPMGYSLGATASIQLSSHEAVVTTVSIHGHSTSGDPHGPVLLLTGTEDVIDSVRDTMSTLEEAPAMLAALPIGHLAVLGELSATGRYVAPITAWLRYWVNGDEDAKRFFWGADCEMCASPWITPETNAPWDAQVL